MMRVRVPEPAASAPTRVEGKRLEEADLPIVIPDPTAADTLTEPGTRSRTIRKRKRITFLSGMGFVLGFALGMALVWMVARYWLGITHF